MFNQKGRLCSFIILNAMIKRNLLNLFIAAMISMFAASTMYLLIPESITHAVDIKICSLRLSLGVTTAQFAILLFLFFLFYKIDRSRIE